MKARILRVLQGLAEFPYPQICRHFVALELVSVLEQSGELDKDSAKDLAEAFSISNDKWVLEILKGIQK